MALLDRQIDVIVTLGMGDFGEGKGNTVTLSGYRVYANITKGGAPSWDAAEVRVYGPSPSLMNQLTRLGKPLDYPRNNTLTVMAGDDVNGKSQVFTGIILTAYGDFDALPDACLLFSATGNIFQATKPVAPISFPGPAGVATIVAQIAAQMGLGFINDGVTGTLTNAYFKGSSIEQLQTCAEHANFNFVTNGGSAQQSVEIWPKGQARGAQGPDIGPTTGLVGYPKYSDAGAIITSLYQPGMGIMSPFNLTTSLQSAAGAWVVRNLNYELECNNPTGDNPWFMNIEAMRRGFVS